MWHRESESSRSSPHSTEPQPLSLTSAPSPVEAPREASQISEGLRVKGELDAQESLSINGQFEGTMHVKDATVTVGPRGRVMADIEAGEVAVYGEVKGSVRGRERVRIGSSGTVTGDVRTPRLTVEEGAVIRGRVHVAALKEEQDRRAPEPRTPAEPPRPMILQEKDASR